MRDPFRVDLAGDGRSGAVSLLATFVRRRDHRDHIYVRRADGSTCDWPFPTYGDRLPHDLCHLVIEEMLAIADGFWGLVADGIDVCLIEGQGILVKDGRPLAEAVNVDLSGLLRAEEAVALYGPTGMDFVEVDGLALAQVASKQGEPARDVRDALGITADPADPGVVAAIHRRLRELGKAWRLARDGEAITLPFVRPSI